MRCFGLEPNRHRCQRQAITSGSYCAEHERALMPWLLEMTNTPDVTGHSGFISVLLRPRHTSSGRIVPDGAKYAVPPSLKNSPTLKVIDHLTNNPSANMRWCAAFVLRKRRDITSIEQLWNSIKNDPAPLVRQQVAVALGKIGTPAVLGPLLEALTHDLDPGVRQASAIAIGNLGYSIAKVDLVNRLANEHVVLVRWDLILALGQIGDTSVESFLTGLAGSERAPALREACLYAIRQIKHREVKEPIK
jgi:hypothetical protein